MSGSGEGGTSLLDRQTSHCPPWDMEYGPLKESREECVPQIVLHRLKRHPYTWVPSPQLIPTFISSPLNSLKAFYSLAYLTRMNKLLLLDSIMFKRHPVKYCP